MIRFHQTFGAHTGRMLEFDRDVIRFGRMPDCEVTFDPRADIDASARHAEVRREGGAWHVIDAGSRNGTWLNGQRVQRAVLSSGDELEFGMGGPRLRVEIVSASSPAWGGGGGGAGGRQVTGPMTPTPLGSGAGPVRANQPTGPATPVPSVSGGGGGVDVSAATIAAPATPLPSNRPSPMGAGSGAVTPPTLAVPPYEPPPSYRPPQSSGAPPSAPPGSSPSEPKRYGERTVGLMIQAALQQAGQGGQPGRAEHSTDFIRAVAADEAQRRSRGLRAVVVVLATLFVLSLAAVAVLGYLYFGGNLGAEDHGAIAAELAARDAGAMFVLMENRNGAQTPVCTAFAVRPDLLATNAHCIVGLEERRAAGATFTATPSTGGTPLAISQMWLHPGFDRAATQPTPDIGLLAVAGQAPVQIPIAALSDLARMGEGTKVYVLGCHSPPSASATVGTISSVTSFTGAAAGPEGAQLMIHDARLGDSSNGSAVLDREGRLVAIHVGQRQGDARSYAVRADLLASLLAGLGR
jgi:hypothetical protein